MLSLCRMILALKQDPTNKQARFSVLMFLISSGKERQAGERFLGTGAVL